MRHVVASGYRLDEGTGDGFATVVLHDEAADLHAAFAPQAGMIGCSLLHRGDELLGQGRGLLEYATSGATWGFPSCIRGPTA